MLKNLVILTIAAVVFNSCKPTDIQVVEEPGKFVSYKNVVYGLDSVDQSADVYLPQTGSKRPVVVLLHGGAWVNPGKYAFDGLGLDTFFTLNGCAVINMNYRLCPKYPYPANVDDIGLVMELIKKRAQEWRLDPNSVCLLGRSAGAHLALLYAYSRNKDNRVKAVIEWSGPVAFIDSSVLYGPLGVNVTTLLGSYAANSDTWRDASPISHLDGAVPTVIFQGTNDSLVFPVQAQLLQNGLQARGVPCMFISCQGDGHGWQQYRWQEWRDATLQWIKYFLLPK